MALTHMVITVTALDVNEAPTVGGADTNVDAVAMHMIDEGDNLVTPAFTYTPRDVDDA